MWKVKLETRRKKQEERKTETRRNKKKEKQIDSNVQT